eukprot:gnl/TRDRNA2_/TRDRNA2_177717_c0_seq5.p1 gnl/TRDRNA2_/TRDRNA2_177717_c0~~gnl/TRDRNA2_/TRDRNA2_177717_c0_seq5.p1  ORF type:complete len:462 (+),score=-42.72 gnl/TRDRNA2_/TRDRNA2_177717_c0_seq5:86-1471(+)
MESKLVLKIILNHFGCNSQIVVRELLTRGPSSLKDLIFETKLQTKYVQKILLVLIKQNCIDCYQRTVYSPDDFNLNYHTNKNYVYVANSYNIAMRLRIPRILKHIRENYGVLIAQLMTVISSYGRLTVEQCSKIAVSCLSVNSKKQKKSPLDELTIQKIIRKRLITDELIEKAPYCCQTTHLTMCAYNHQIDPRLNTETTTTSKENIMWYNVASTQKTLPGDILPKRFLKSTERGFGKTEIVENQWRINLRKFNSDLRKDECATIMAKRHGKKGGFIIQTMLKMKKISYLNKKKFRSYPLSANEIADEISSVKKTNVNYSMITAQEITCQLQNMASLDRDLETITSISSNTGHFTFIVNIGRIIELSQIQHMELLVYRRIGTLGRRIIKFLTLAGIQELKQIAAKCLISQTTTRKLLFRLLKHGFVRVIELTEKGLYTIKIIFMWKYNTKIIKQQDFKAIC